MRKLRLWIILCLFLWLSIEIVAFLGLKILEIKKSIKYDPFPVASLNTSQKELIENILNGTTEYTAHHPLLGWSIKPNGRSTLYQSNAQGLRADRDYAENPANGILRINTYGDSFIHGDEVANNETWQAYMEQFSNKIEVLNFGVGGYGLDQAFLRYQLEGRKFKSQIVLIGYMFTDIERTVNTFRPFFLKDSGLPLTKPRFKIIDGKLTLIKNPLSDVNDYKKLLAGDQAIIKKIAAHDFYYHKKYFKGPLDFLPSIRLFKIGRRQYKILTNEKAKSVAYKTEELIFREFYHAVKRDGARPIIVFFPNKFDIYAAKQKKTKRYSELLEIFKRNHLEYIDLIDAFELQSTEHALEDLFQKNKHYSPLANRSVAKFILKALRQKNMIK